MLNNINYNPDVLSCLANLSSDEVFTPPELVNSMLDLLPREIWTDEAATFLDPSSKSGVFLREIVKRLNAGLVSKIPNTEERLSHIFKNQVFGIAISELTSLVSRRTVYCSKSANGKFSLFPDAKDVNGNVIFHETSHTWKSGSCTFCGAKTKGNERSSSLETHAYQFIHTNSPKDIFNMKFDVIVGNPPYQLDTGGSGKQATPLYHKFVQQAKQLNPRYLTMIIPSRWFAGGMGLNEFRADMMADKRLRKIVDFQNSKDCFPGVSISGGVCYFLWERNYDGDVEFVNKTNQSETSMNRRLNEFKYVVRQNQAVSIIHKVNRLNEQKLESLVSSINPFNFTTAARGQDKSFPGAITLHHSKGKGYVEHAEVNGSRDLINKFKVMLSQTTSEHAGEPSKDGTFKLLAKIEVLPPREISTFSYLVLGSFDDEESATNLKLYLQTKFVRYLLLQAITSIHITKDKFIFVPMQDFTQTWTDDALYAKYDLDEAEIDFIETLIKPIEG